MGYFSNGTESEMYESQYCNRCIHQDDLLAVVEAADGLAEALTEAIEDLEPKVAAAVGTIGPASGLVRCIAWREKLSRYAAAKGKVTG